MSMQFYIASHDVIFKLKLHFVILFLTLRIFEKRTKYNLLYYYNNMVIEKVIKTD